jgi:hypothetical protein
MGTQNAYGKLAPPMLAASSADGNFIGPGNWYPRYEAAGKISLFKDRFCEEPWS